jgi:hypothetical protein
LSIHESISIIIHSDIGLFGGFDQATVKCVWTLFIKVIFAPNMVQHFGSAKPARKRDLRAEQLGCDEGRRYLEYVPAV